MTTLNLIFFISALIQLPCSFFVLWAIYRYRKQKKKEREAKKIVSDFIKQWENIERMHREHQNQETNYLQ